MVHPPQESNGNLHQVPFQVPVLRVRSTLGSVCLIPSTLGSLQRMCCVCVVLTSSTFSLMMPSPSLSNALKAPVGKRKANASPTLLFSCHLPLLFFFFKGFGLVYLCLLLEEFIIVCMWAQNKCRGQRGSSGIGSLLPPYEFRPLNSDHQTHTAEPS